MSRAALATLVSIVLSVATALPAAGAAGSAGAAPPQAEIFERGNQRYQAGDYAAAIEAYEAVLSAGYDGADLRYNLGNAWYKSGELGRAILEWERALVRSPGLEDAAANLALARTLTADDIEPLPRFWLLSVVSWWVDLVPRGPLVALVALAWILCAAGLAVRIVARSDGRRRLAGWVAVGAGIVVVVFGANLAVRQTGLVRPELAVVLADAVPVRSAPAEGEALTLFEVHEGTKVRVDRRTDEWAEIVLEDGKVGWVPVRVMETI